MLPPKQPAAAKLYPIAVCTVEFALHIHISMRCLTTFMFHVFQGSNKPWRPQEKSVQMYERIFSCMTQTEAFAKVGGVVVELRCGTSNGAIAALRLGVPYFGVDRDGDCLRDAQQRIRWYANQMNITGMYTLM